MLDLNLPSTEEVKKEVQQELLPTAQEKEVIESSIEKQTNEVMSVNVDSFEERKEIVSVIESFGVDIMTQSQKKNSILQRRIGDIGQNGGESGAVAKSLGDLTIKMKDLDPSGIDFVKTGKLGKFFNPVRKYFEKYKTADAEISAIVKSLDNGKKTLINDNTTLELEQASMREMTKKVTQSIELGTQLDASVSAAIEKAKSAGENEEKIKFIEEEILYPLRQRITDFQQFLLVNQQGIIAMDLTRRNNKELIRSVDRAKMVTVNALRTAVTLAGALYDQKIVLEKVTALNDTTNHIIESTAKMLKEQGTAIHKQASESAISVETFKQAFTDTMEALEEISTYKTEALPRLKQTINEYQDMAAMAEKQIEKMEHGNTLME